MELPTVTASASTIQATAALKVEPKAIVIAKDVTDCVELVAAAKAAGKAQRAADKARDAALITLFSKLLGINELDELKLMAPNEVNAKLIERFKAGLIDFDPTCPEFDIDNEKDQTRPAWKDAYVAALGQVAANKVVADTPTKFTYRPKLKEKAKAAA